MANVYDIPFTINHTSIGINQLENACAFYEDVHATIGATKKEILSLAVELISF